MGHVYGLLTLGLLNQNKENVIDTILVSLFYGKLINNVSKFQLNVQLMALSVFQSLNVQKPIQMEVV